MTVFFIDVSSIYEAPLGYFLFFLQHPPKPCAKIWKNTYDLASLRLRLLK